LGGKVAFVTGASGGLGSAISQTFAAFGADLAIVARNREKLDTTAKMLEKFGGKVTPIEADVTNPRQVTRMVSDALKTFGRIDILVNAHGLNIRKPSEVMSVSDWEEVVNANLKGVFLCCQAVGKAMIQQNQGKIVNVSSTAGKIGYDKGYSAYSPSKAGVDALTRTLASEWAKYNINVNSVAPYFVETEMTKKVLSDKRFHQWVFASLPMKRLGKPSDVAGAVVFLSSKASDWITGQTVYIDGGRTIV